MKNWKYNTKANSVIVILSSISNKKNYENDKGTSISQTKLKANAIYIYEY